MERYTSQCDFVNRPVLSISFSMAWFDLIYKGVPSITPWITIVYSAKQKLLDNYKPMG